MVKDKKVLRKLDSLFGIVITLVSAFFVYQCYLMPWSGISGGGILAAPGLLPIIISSVLVVLGICMTITGVKEGGKITREDIKSAINILKGESAKRIFVMAVIIGTYALILIGRMPFAIATFIYMYVFLFLFKAGNWWQCLLLSIITSGIITYAFGSIVNIPLP